MIVEVARLGEQVTAEQVLELAQAVEREDRVAALSEQTLLEVRRPTRTVRHVLVLEDGTLVGYAQTDRGEPGPRVDAGRPPSDAGPVPEPAPPSGGALAPEPAHPSGGALAPEPVDPSAMASAELAVHPAHRRHGVGRALLDAVRATGPVSVWAHGNLPAAQALARGAGMEMVRELLQMSAPLAPTEPPSHHGHGITVRAFEPGLDEDAWVALNARAFARHPEQGRMTAEDLRAREAEDWFDPSLLWLAYADDGEAPVASMWVKVLPGADDGEIYALGVDPDAQGRGLGGMLTRRAVAELARRGLRTATLYVEGDNEAALRTYRREGFRVVAVDVQYR